MASSSSRSASVFRHLASVLLACCLVEAAQATSVSLVSFPGRIARRLLQDPSICPSELGFTACFAPNGSTFTCDLGSCGSETSFAASPGSGTEILRGVRTGGTVLVNFFTALATNDYEKYKIAVKPNALYWANHDPTRDKNARSDNGQARNVFDALRTLLNISPGADYSSIFKVRKVGYSFQDVLTGVGFVVDYPSVNPIFTFYISIDANNQFDDFDYLPYGTR